MIVKNYWSNQKSIPKDLILAKELVYDCFDFDCSQPKPVPQNTDHDAFHFHLNKKNICYREAKITPIETGHFATLWKRNKMGTIEPFDFSDDIDFVIISARKDYRFGQFIFPKSILLEKGIFSTKTKEGKRNIRVYPPWTENTNLHADKNQWQLRYFFEITPEVDFDAFSKLIQA